MKKIANGRRRRRDRAASGSGCTSEAVSSGPVKMGAIGRSAATSRPPRSPGNPGWRLGACASTRTSGAMGEAAPGSMRTSNAPASGSVAAGTGCPAAGTNSVRLGACASTRTSGAVGEATPGSLRASNAPASGGAGTGRAGAGTNSVSISTILACSTLRRDIAASTVRFGLACRARSSAANALR